jgi:putative N6-adenine-specific DNA methylase
LTGAKYTFVPLIRYFATCARGLEPILADELRALAARDVTTGRGGVAFAGDKALLYKANLWLRTAVRVLRPVLEAPVTTPEELYAAVQSIDWEQFLTPAHTLAVDCNVRDSRITHSQYAARVVKDAICDQFVQRCGRRPSVDPERPMLGLNLHIYKDDAVLSLDSSWDSLHKRGYRPILTKAPLNEALAAAIVLRTGWRGEATFVDPLCGSGTLPIEAAWIALHRPPGLTRKHFGFMGWMEFDVRLWTELRDEARAGVRKRPDYPIVGGDERRDAIEHSRTNARAAGVGHVIQFEIQNVHDFKLPVGKPGVLVCNPPYGERIGEEKELRSLYRLLGAVFGRLSGWRVWVFTGNPRLAGLIDLPRAEEVALFNGRIPCRLIRFLI